MIPQQTDNQPNHNKPILRLVDCSTTNKIQCNLNPVVISPPSKLDVSTIKEAINNKIAGKRDNVNLILLKNSYKYSEV